MAAVTMSPGYSSPVGRTAVGLTAQEQKDMERFVKFLSQKMVQVIVQSRLGEKVCTPCKAHPSTADWFNLGIEDIPEVSAETKKALQGRLLSVGSQPLCVEISLRTVEGDSLILETWSLSVSESTEPSNRVTYTVYSRMSLLLKSIISVSRVTPAYKLSGRQGADSFVLCYRVFCGEPHPLGTSVNNCTIGQVDTPFGVYSVILSYRTQLTLSPKDGAMLVKSDHFTPEFSPRLCRASSDRREKERDRGGESSSGSEHVGTSDESQDACRLFVNSPPSNKVAPGSDFAQREQRFSFDDAPKFGAFADPSACKRNLSVEFSLPELPLPTFMKFQTKEAKTKESVIEEPDSPTSPSSKEVGETDTTRSSSSLGQNKGDSSGEDFVMVESLKTPFASGEGDPSQDVGAFFRECQSAPLSLQSFNRTLGAAGAAAQEIGSQLEQFEKDMQAYDDLVQSLCLDPDVGSSGGSTGKP